jgi:RND family efflux transporter MFP subunit
MKTKAIIITIAVLVLLGIWFAVQTSKTKTSEGQIKTAAVKRETFIKSVQSSGKTKADKSAELKFQTSGKLLWLGIAEGDKVVQGQAIAKLDTAKLEATLRQEEQDFVAAKAKSEKLYNTQGAKTAESYDEKISRTAVDATQNIAYDAVVKARQDIADATLVTPIAGIVAHIDIPIAGENITPASTVFEIVDPSSLVFQANIDEVDIGSLSLGQTASVALDAFPDATFSGKVSYISYISETSAGGATVFPVKIAFDEPQKLRIGLNGDITIETTNVPDVIVVPLEAIREQKTGKFVYKKTGKTYALVPVKIGDQSDTEVVITQGLNQGDDVVIKGFSYVDK